MEYSVRDDSIVDVDTGKFVYRAYVKFAADVRSYVKDRRFEIVMRDMLLHGKDFVITSDDILVGRYAPSSMDIVECLVATGVVVYVSADDTVTVAFTLPTDGHVGFAAAKLFFKFFDSDGDDIAELDAPLLPYVLRTDSPWPVESSLDPILPSSAYRPAYDFDTDGQVRTDFIYGSTGSFYSNGISGAVDTVPVYLSRVSAYVPSGMLLESTSVESYITDYRGYSASVDYDIGEPSGYEPEILPHHTAQLQVYDIDQYLYTPPGGTEGYSVVLRITAVQ